VRQAPLENRICYETIHDNNSDFSFPGLRSLSVEADLSGQDNAQRQRDIDVDESGRIHL
jgi:hypothetical protein